MVERGTEPGGDSYRITKAGAEHLDRWVRGARLDDVGQVILMARDEASACELASEAAPNQMLSFMWEEMTERRRKLGDQLEVVRKQFRGKAG